MADWTGIPGYDVRNEIQVRLVAVVTCKRFMGEWVRGCLATSRLIRPRHQHALQITRPVEDRMRICCGPALSCHACQHHISWALPAWVPTVILDQQVE